MAAALAGAGLSPCDLTPISNEEAVDLLTQLGERWIGDGGGGRRRGHSRAPDVRLLIIGSSHTSLATRRALPPPEHREDPKAEGRTRVPKELPSVRVPVANDGEQDSD